mmetsp:Transcript_10871/g.23114  ORF Transcript_10871/g.23114 Transcript_10871/m.23114 type:complete len:1206 (+) Transcript_10871:171-3788(+)
MPKPNTNTNTFLSTMSDPSRQKIFLFSLILSGFCIYGIQSFAQNGRSSMSMMHQCSIGRRHHYNHHHHHHQHHRRSVPKITRKTNALLPLHSVSPNHNQAHHQKRKGTNKNYEGKNKYSRKTNSHHNNNGYRRQGGGGMNEFSHLNRKVIQQETAQDVLNLLAATKGALSSVAGGGTMSTVNFSTSIHRIARHLTLYTSKNKPGNERAQILSDPRFALFICSMSEALLDGAEKYESQYKASNNRNNQSPTGRVSFGARELSNIVWAIAKLKIAPPNSVLSVDIDNAENLLREKSKKVRSLIFDIAKQRALSGSSSSSSSSWIPALSELCGVLMDTVSAKVLDLDPKRFQQQELSNLMWASATAQRPSENVFEYVVSSIIGFAEQRKKDRHCNENNPNNKDSIKDEKGAVPQEWSIPLWVLAKSGTDLGHEEELLPFVNDMMDNEPGFLERFKPQELSNSVWAAATIISKRPQAAKGAASDAALGILRHTSRELIRRKGEGYKTQELANSAWAMATLGFGIKKNTASSAAKGCHLTHTYTYLVSDDPKGDRALMEEAIKITLKKTKENVRRFTSQELNNLCWVMARLEEKDEELINMIGKELANPRKSVNSQDLSTYLWSMATMEYYDEDLYRSIVARFHSIGPHGFNPQEFSNTVWALATAGVIPEHVTVFDNKLLPADLRPTMEDARRDPITSIFAAAASELIRRPNEFKTQEIKDILWSFTRVGMRHPELFRSVAEYLVGKDDSREMTGRGLDEFNSQGLANLAYSFARHTQLGGETMNKYERRCRIPFTGGKLAYYTISYLDVGEGLLRELFAAIAKADIENFDNLSKCSAQDVSNTVWAFGILGLKHERFLKAVEGTLRQRMESYLSGDKSVFIQGQEMSNALWALATLNYIPNGLLSFVERYFLELLDHDLTVTKISQLIDRQELANIAWVAAVFGEYPSNLIKMLYMGILGVGERPDAAYMQKIYSDSGIQATHSNSMLYLQIMMDFDLGLTQNTFSLPEDFPSAWASNLAMIDDNESSSGNGIMEIHTTTSGTQNRISMAFDRINFGHVDEYLMTMKDLTADFEIQMPPFSVEVISLDIANIDSKIGVEVDGPGHWVSNIDSSTNHNILSSVGEYRGPAPNDNKKDNNNRLFEYNFNWNSDDQMVNGATSLKQRMFQHMGWKIINIPFWEWNRVDSNLNANDPKKCKAQEDYCRSLLL